MTKKIKIAIISALFLAGIYSFAQQVYTYHCIRCGKILQSTNSLSPKCCGFYISKK
ncbi:hypothetical protein [Intestinicryptomonas porci]|uniref:Uncharacterized protein n=1 Tax=Intestinicryptomonas porci TaxID=2926320 RepID=A0ABU4WFW9_9BACT|nr:hypothetical protein [Opitutales bacterium CLA-KB-P66]